MYKKKKSVHKHIVSVVQNKMGPTDVFSPDKKKKTLHTGPTLYQVSTMY